jgi:hypothetical protein
METNWPRPYSPLDGDARSAFEAELLRELQQGHRLFGIPVKAVARRRDLDDALFELLDGTGRVAVVHLTWQGKQKPPWPSTTIFEGFEAWARAVEEESREQFD